MKARFSDQYGNEVIYKLFDTELGHAFERLLPMTVELQKTGSNERSFLAPKRLNTFGANLAPGGEEVLCYHVPWQQIVLYFDGYSQYEDMYEIGMPIFTEGSIRNMRGPVLIEEIY